MQGSGAKTAISSTMINTGVKAFQIPLIVGGGIRTPEMAASAAEARCRHHRCWKCNRKDPNLVKEMSIAVHEKSKAMSEEMG